MWSQATTLDDMKTAGIRELKARLSSYLREVESGEVILVTDRGRVVAEVRPPNAADAAATPAELRYRQLVERGAVSPAAQPQDRAWAEWPGLGLPAGTAQAIIDAERE
jgi:antitoxin (DNA-binding transcriptional repressor) of toxin-antitoxin stability system